MEGQMSIYDVCPEIKKPELWSCMETCANCGKIMDHFPTDRDRKRCLFGYSQETNFIAHEVDEQGIVHFYCNYYELK